MFRNKFEISKIIGFILLGPCFLVGSILLEEVRRRSEYFEWDIYHTITLVSLTIGVLCAIGLILKLNWVRYLIVILFIVLTLVWLYLFVTEIGFEDREVSVALGLTAFVVILTVGMGLMLFNEKVEKEFGLEQEVEHDLLDW